MFDVMPYWMWVASLIVRARGDVRRSAVVRTFEVSRSAPRTSRTPQTPLEHDPRWAALASRPARNVKLRRNARHTRRPAALSLSILHTKSNTCVNNAPRVIDALAAVNCPELDEIARKA